MLYPLFCCRCVGMGMGGEGGGWLVQVADPDNSAGSGLDLNPQHGDLGQVPARAQVAAVAQVPVPVAGIVRQRGSPSCRLKSTLKWKPRSFRWLTILFRSKFSNFLIWPIYPSGHFLMFHFFQLFLLPICHTS
jgi:hypothetical protein